MRSWILEKVNNTMTVCDKCENHRFLILSETDSNYFLHSSMNLLLLESSKQFSNMIHTWSLWSNSPKCLSAFIEKKEVTLSVK